MDMHCGDSLHAVRTRQHRSVHANQWTHHLKSFRSRKFPGTYKAAKVVFRSIVLDMVSNLVTALKHDDRRAYLTPLRFRYKGVRTMGTADLMFCFAVLGKCQRAYLGHPKNTLPDSC